MKFRKKKESVRYSKSGTLLRLVSVFPGDALLGQILVNVDLTGSFGEAAYGGDDPIVLEEGLVLEEAETALGLHEAGDLAVPVLTDETMSRSEDN